MGVNRKTPNKLGIIGTVLQAIAIVLPAVGSLVGGLVNGASLASRAFATGAQATLLLYGQALSFAGSVLSNFTRSPRDQSTNDSPAYSFVQFDNPVKGEASIAVAYGDPGDDGDLLGVKVAPIYLQAFTTPRGYHADSEDEFRTSSRGETLSGLLAVCHGPVDRITDHQFNGQPLFLASKREQKAVTGKTHYRIGPLSVDRESVRVRVTNASGKDEFRGPNLIQRTSAFRGNGSQTVFILDIDDEDDVADEIDMTFAIAPSYGGKRVRLSDSTAERVHVFATSPKRVVLNLQNYAMPDGYYLFATYSVRRWYGMSIQRAPNGDRAMTAKFFGETVGGTSYAKPTTGDVIHIEHDERIQGGLEIGVTRGGNAQLTPPGFDSIRQTYPQNQALGFNASATFTTNEACDNVVVTISTGPNGFRRFNSEGKVLGVHADFKLEFRPNGSSDPYLTVLDPRGTQATKRNDEFRIAGEVGSERRVSFSIRGLLQQWLRKHPNTANGKARLDTWTKARRKWDIRVTRTSREQGLSNSSYFDKIILASHREEVDVALTYAGVALAYFHNAHPRIAGGRVPQYTCRTTGIRALPAVSGGAWTTSTASRGNPVWAAIDLITDSFYGAGAQFTLASNIDMASAIAAAAWCDASVTLEDGATTEKRSRIDYTADAPRPVMTHVTRMLTAARVVPVLQGNKWRFPILNAVDSLSDLPQLIDGTLAGRVEAGTIAMSHDTIASEVTEIEIEFYDGDNEFERAIVPMTPESPVTQPRVRKVTVLGARRRSEVTRYGAWLYAQTQWSPRQLRIRVTTTMAFARLEAGDVFRLTSTRNAIDAYFRVEDHEVDQSTMSVRISATEYVPQLNGQTYSHTRIIKPVVTQTDESAPFTPTYEADRLPSRRRTRKRIRKVRARVRRVA